jgi:hypothetical protein
MNVPIHSNSLPSRSLARPARRRLESEGREARILRGFGHAGGSRIEPHGARWHPQTLCEPECPAEAIYAEDDLPPEQAHFLHLNKELSRQWPVITEMKPAPPDAKDWDGKPDKLKLLEK